MIGTYSEARKHSSKQHVILRSENSVKIVILKQNGQHSLCQFFLGKQQVHFQVMFSFWGYFFLRNYDGSCVCIRCLQPVPRSPKKLLELEFMKIQSYILKCYCAVFGLICQCGLFHSPQTQTKKCPVSRDFQVGTTSI